MRALLEQKLHSANLSFAEWTVLAFINASPLSSRQLVQRQISGHVVTDAADAQTAINSLIAGGFIATNQDNMLTHTEKGAVVFKPLRTDIEELTRALYADLPSADLEATHRTLMEIATRANHLLVR